MPFHDLNVSYITDHSSLNHTLAFHTELGYKTIALSLSVAGKLPSQPQTILLSSLTAPKGTTLLTRLTLTLSDTSQNHRLASLQPHYDLIALRPTTEKALQIACTSLECDLISLDLAQRLPFILRFKTLAAALQRGVRFEICYAPGISGGGDARRNVISGAVALIRATRGRGIILSSEARDALGLRGPYDVMNLAQVWGLGQERGKEGLCEEAAKVVRLAGLKRTSFRGVVDVIDGVGTEDGSKGKEKNAELEQSRQATEKATNPANAIQIHGQRHDSPASNGVKRKASSTTLTAIPANEELEEQLVSKRELKRRAKKAKLEGTAPPRAPTQSKPNEFPVKHETLTTGPKKKG